MNSEIMELNKTAWAKTIGNRKWLLTDELRSLKTFLEYEIENIESILHSAKKPFIDNNIIENLEYIINDIGHYYSKDSICGYSEITDTNFTTLETILNEIKESKRHD